MKIKKFFLKSNHIQIRGFCRKCDAMRHYHIKAAKHRFSHVRIEDRLGNIIVSNRIITKVA